METRDLLTVLESIMSFREPVDTTLALVSDTGFGGILSEGQALTRGIGSWNRSTTS